MFTSTYWRNSNPYFSILTLAYLIATSSLLTSWGHVRLCLPPFINHSHSVNRLWDYNFVISLLMLPQPSAEGLTDAWIIVHAIVHTPRRCNTTKPVAQAGLTLTVWWHPWTLPSSVPSSQALQLTTNGGVFLQSSCCCLLCWNTCRTLYLTSTVFMPCWLILLVQWYFYIRIVA